MNVRSKTPLLPPVFSSEMPMKAIASTRIQLFRLTRISATKRTPLGDLTEVCGSFQACGRVARSSTEEIRVDRRLNVRNTPSHNAMRCLNRILVASLLAIATFSSLMAEVPEQARAAIDRITGGKGAYIADEGVYKVVLPREAATIVQDYQTLSPNIGLNSWVAFMPAIHHEALLTGQLLLLEDEVDSVLTITLDAGLEVTGLADSSLFNGPRVKALDVMGVGTYQNLASAFRKTLDEIRRMRADASRHVAKLALPELHV